MKNRDSDQHKANLASANPGIRWQAEMEDHLDNVRTLSNEALLHGIHANQADFRATLANAHATAALALALANSLGDLEMPLTEIATQMKEHNDA